MIQHSCQETEPLLSGYLDGELTAGDRQRVELILDDCMVCGQAFDEMRKMRQRFGAIDYEKMTSQEKDQISRTAQESVGASVGQVLFLVGVFIVYGVGAFWMVRGLIGDSEAPLFLRVGAPIMILGMGVLFFTVLFQRIKAAKTDKYRNVRI